MSNTDIRIEVAQSLFAKVLSPSSLDSLLATSKLIEMPAGHFLFREGEVRRQIYLLLDGQVDLEMTVPGRGPVRILSLGKGELVGWSGLLHHGSMTSSAQCTTDCRLLELDCDRIVQLTQTDHEFGYQVMKMMADSLARRLLATRLQLLDLFDVPQSM